ncbi:uncharacterized protein CLAFUR5_04211 [Fulvia fulva]|uniref:Uncharacterized protein n=1 Tax=Passalora fulva TaxID=5499 RepID=A0A9Q8LE69_PASFU|nr:uncharacterized protein CLAFUR5_04211 [Fulvia fulva]KAK4627541.1 hypothetical protein CLAFUR0_04233 [Fulvia fulva]UJO15845.1 hypothetical protein CLAFUR5_04211 [Fulvia fulva]
MAGHYIPGWGELDDALVVVPEVARMNIQRFVQNDTRVAVKEVECDWFNPLAWAPNDAINYDANGNRDYSTGIDRYESAETYLTFTEHSPSKIQMQLWNTAGEVVSSQLNGDTDSSRSTDAMEAC